MINYGNFVNLKRGLRKQRGGTVVGIIIGLIIGLAIALVVAVAITKSSLPFMNKVAKQDKAPELTAGQAADPNKPLYGNNNAAKDAAKDFSPGATPGAATAGAPAADGKPAAPAAPATPASASTPAKPADAKTAEAAAPAAAAKPDNAEDKWTYYLQAGAFRDQADAENSKAKLALAGFEASISDKGNDANALYRVRLGPFNQLEAMNRVRGKLSDNGIDVAVVRVAK
ncbi:MAG TPA: SPOR domain-containing protein [Burkholderiaceae bacterium]|jgi:cell division protein FtsN